MNVGRYVQISLSVLALVVSVLALVSQQRNKKKVAYVSNQIVFDGFEGKALLEQKLNFIKDSNKSFLDSLSQLAQSGRTDVIASYREKAGIISEQERQLTEKYTQDIWAYLNDAIYQYGKTYEYDYILGTSGTGTLMYADSVNDVSEDVVRFINQKYRGN